MHRNKGRMEEYSRLTRDPFKVTLRSLLLGVLLIPVNVYWVTLAEVKYYSLDGSCLPLFIEPVFMLFVVTCLNFVLKWFTLRSALNQAELLMPMFVYSDNSSCNPLLLTITHFWGLLYQ
ncbi:DUF6785 family protein [Candidatus Poribacteria bacterium]